MAKRKGRRSSVRSASKVQEEEFIEKARAIAQDPSLVLPECRGPCIFFCPFKRARQQILKVHAVRDDPEKLKRATTRGDVMARAYAATLTLTHSEKAPHLAQARLPTGNVSYILRGSVPPFNLIGIQYYDEPALRLLGAFKHAKSRKLHVYSTEDRLITTHKKAAAPPEFVAFQTAELELPERAPGHYACPHVGEEPTLKVTWKSANVTLERCADCAESKNLVYQILEHYVAPDATRDFDLALGGVTLPGTADAVLSREDDKAYRKASIGDAELIARMRAARHKALRARKERVFIVGGTSHGSDAKAFIESLHPTPVERAALEAAVAGLQRPVVIDRASPVRALHDLWPERGLVALTALAGSEEAARPLYAPDAGPEAIAEALPRAADLGDRRKLDATLPSFQNLPKPVAFADQVARMHRLRGRDESIRSLANRATSDSKEKAVTLAMLQALGSAQGQEWKYGRTEVELAEFLQEPAKRLLEGGAEEYGAALEDLARRAGYNEPLRRA